MARRNKRCAICKTRKYVTDSNTGFVRCVNGHFLEGVVSEAHVVDWGGGHAMQKRRTRTGPRTNKRVLYGQRDQEYWFGDAAQILRLQALQLLLRFQIKAVRELFGVPEVYESIVRQLWELRLLTSPLPPPPGGPSRQSSPQAAGTSSQRASQVHRDEKEDEKNDSDGGSLDSDAELEARFVAEEDQKSDEEGPDDEHNLPDLDVDVSDDSDDDGDKEEGDKEEGLREVPQEETPERPQERILTVSDTLTCLILGLWIMCTPFTYVRLVEVINRNQIPFIEFFKSTLLPAEMKKHMNRTVRMSLMPGRAPKPMYLWNNTRRFAQIVHRRFNLKIPEINVRPVAWHVVCRLGGDEVTYRQVLALLHTIDANMKIVATEYTKIVHKRRNKASVEFERVTRKYDVVMPELSVAAAWVIVMKLGYGLDGKKRVALLEDDPLIGRPKGDAWVKELALRTKEGKLDPFQHLEPQLFASMSPDSIDAFLNDAEDVLLTNREEERWATGNFPLPPKVAVPRTPSAWDSWAEFRARAAADPVVQAPPVPAGTRNDALPLMPGEMARRYEASDVTGTLPWEMFVVTGAAAQVAGVRREELLEVIEAFERRLERLRPKSERPLGNASYTPRRRGTRPQKRRLARTHKLLRETRRGDDDADSERAPSPAP